MEGWTESRRCGAVCPNPESDLPTTRRSTPARLVTGLITERGLFPERGDVGLAARY